MESEIELHDAIVELNGIATVPDLYPLVVELGAVPSILELLAHENSDISVAVVNLLQVSLGQHVLSMLLFPIDLTSEFSRK